MRYILTSLALLAATPAIAQDIPCAPIDQAYETLTEKYGERRIVAGYTDTGASIEFWLNPNGAGWSMLGVTGNEACLLANGQDWTFDIPKDGDPT